MTQYNSVNEALDAISEAMADLRGEALAGRMLATVTLDLLLQVSSEPRKLLSILEETIERSVAKIEFPAEPSDLDNKAREIARLRCLETLDSIRSMY